MAHEYPFLAFTFKGRIKSLIRAEEKFNGYVVEYIYDYYRENGTYPSVAELKNKLSCFRDFIAYRIVVCMPRCHLKPGEDQEQASIRYLYEIANVLPGFLEERGFTAESAQGVKLSTSDQLNDNVKPYYISGRFFQTYNNSSILHPLQILNRHICLYASLVNREDGDERYRRNSLYFDSLFQGTQV